MVGVNMRGPTEHTVCANRPRSLGSWPQRIRSVRILCLVAAPKVGAAGFLILPQD